MAMQQRGHHHQEPDILLRNDIALELTPYEAVVYILEVFRYRKEILREWAREHHSTLFEDLDLDDLRKKYLHNQGNHFSLHVGEDFNFSKGQTSSSEESSDDDDFSKGTKHRVKVHENAGSKPEKDNTSRYTRRQKDVCKPCKRLKPSGLLSRAYLDDVLKDVHARCISSKSWPCPSCIELGIGDSCNDTDPEPLSYKHLPKTPHVCGLRHMNRYCSFQGESESHLEIYRRLWHAQNPKAIHRVRKQLEQDQLEQDRYPKRAASDDNDRRQEEPPQKKLRESTRQTNKRTMYASEEDN